ncbi:MerR family transcriptional regulator [Brevibacterium sp. UCMA 11752]|uniref:MerR family transcriptional regulator n=1 Tax=Brevibacterium sp. UCMA 11752 TaxID=2745946 RepID=UPI001F424C62|nr:MerR family transcriptional regulator [Brevibacterium sp. UCMA 11752]MCF2587051.1 MerR family transcriptional regulator [Brevibacterium sp. UCMA 11752]
MKLSALARESGVSTASIKYYIHVGILLPGRKRNATTAEYSQAHVDRLGLITCLRRELGSPIESIAALTRAIDDEALENIELMGICQRLALEASNVLKSATGSSSPSEPEPEPAAAAAAEPEHQPEPEPEPKTIENDIRDVLQELGWPDISPTAVASMAGALEELSASGYPVGRDTILRHIQALTEIAGRNTAPITDSLSRDRICVEVVRGITMHNRLLAATSALVHASLSAMPRSSQS